MRSKREYVFSAGNYSQKERGESWVQHIWQFLPNTSQEAGEGGKNLGMVSDAWWNHGKGEWSVEERRFTPQCNYVQGLLVSYNNITNSRLLSLLHIQQDINLSSQINVYSTNRNKGQMKGILSYPDPLSSQNQSSEKEPIYIWKKLIRKVLDG